MILITVVIITILTAIITGLVFSLRKVNKQLLETERFLNELHVRYEMLKETPVKTAIPTEDVVEEPAIVTPVNSEMNGIQRSIARDSLGLIPTNETHSRK